MRNLILLIIIIFVTGCNNIVGNGTSALETGVKKATAVDIDLDNLKNSERNKANINIKDEGMNLNGRFKDGFSTITATREGISITITNEENGMDNMLISFTGADYTKIRPIKGRWKSKGDHSMNFSIVNYKSNGVEMLMGLDVEGKILSLNPEKTIISLKGKIGYEADAENPEKWKDFEGTIILNYPVFQALGNPKDDFVY